LNSARHGISAVSELPGDLEAVGPAASDFTVHWDGHINIPKLAFRALVNDEHLDWVMLGAFVVNAFHADALATVISIIPLG